LGRWWRPLGIDLVIYKSGYLFRVFDSRTLYFILLLLFSQIFYFWFICHFMSFM
jgi:hypothetical protein